MAQYGLTEPEANTIITQGVDFSVTQVVDGNWGVHSVIPKKIFMPYLGESDAASVAKSGTSSLGEADCDKRARSGGRNGYSSCM